MKFTYESENVLSIKSDDNACIEMHLVEDLVYVDDYEFFTTHDTLNSIALLIDGNWVCLSGIVIKARMAYDGIYAEYMQEQADEQSMASELSSPSQTGRI